MSPSQFNLKFQQVGVFVDTACMAFYPICALANEICDRLGGLLQLSNSNNASVYAPVLVGQAARHNSIETGRANLANTMDLAGIIIL